MKKAAITPVMLAKDVLKWLDPQTKPRERPDIRPQCAIGYVRILRKEHGGRDLDANGRLDDLLRKGRACQVCGIGALLVAKAVRVDGVEIVYGMLATTDQDYGSDRPSQRLANQRMLEGIFTAQQLTVIEDAFEGGDGLRRPDATATDRLREICRNIIRNKGQFVPKGAK